MMNIFWMVWKFVRQDWLKPRMRCINEGVGDEEFDMRLSFSERLYVVWFVVVIGWNPLWEPHLDNGKLGPFDRMFEIITRSGISRMNKRASIIMFKAIAEWIDSIIVVYMEAFPVPSIDCSGVCFDECDSVESIIQTSRECEVAQRLQSCLDST